MEMSIGLIGGVCLLVGYAVGALTTYNLFRKLAKKKNMWEQLIRKEAKE